MLSVWSKIFLLLLTYCSFLAEPVPHLGICLKEISPSRLLVPSSTFLVLTYKLLSATPRIPELGFTERFSEEFIKEISNRPNTFSGSFILICK